MTKEKEGREVGREGDIPRRPYEALCLGTLFL